VRNEINALVWRVKSVTIRRWTLDVRRWTFVFFELAFFKTF
jgi:hypothetical protein